MKKLAPRHEACTPQPQYCPHTHARSTTYLIFVPLGRKGACSSANRRPERIHTARRRKSWIWDTSAYGACAQPRLASYGYRFSYIDKYTVFWVNALTTCVTNNNARPRRRLLCTSACEVQSSGLNKPQMIISQDVADMAFNYRSKRTE